MTDDRLGRAAGQRLRAKADAHPNPHGSVQQAMAQVRQTDQVRRRWWLPSWHRKAVLSPDINQTFEYPPDPVPATNGHSPTVTGRTQSMLSPAKAITAGALVFAVGGVLLVAQPFDQQGSAPGAEADDPAMAPSFFSGAVGNASRWVQLAEGVNETGDDGVVHGSGGLWTFPLDSDDPRFSGQASITGNETDYREGATTLDDTGLAGVVSTNVMRLENEYGAWEGEYRGLAIDALDLDSSAGWLTGSGDYEGLSAYFVWDFPNIVGHITAEGPPPAPEGLPE